jgi:hypothetical protein
MTSLLAGSAGHTHRVAFFERIGLKWAKRDACS